MMYLLPATDKRGIKPATDKRGIKQGAWPEAAQRLPGEGLLHRAHGLRGGDFPASWPRGGEVFAKDTSSRLSMRLFFLKNGWSS